MTNPSPHFSTPSAIICPPQTMHSRRPEPGDHGRTKEVLPMRIVPPPTQHMPSSAIMMLSNIQYYVLSLSPSLAVHNLNANRYNKIERRRRTRNEREREKNSCCSSLLPLSTITSSPTIKITSIIISPISRVFLKFETKSNKINNNDVHQLR